jgi:hypothetical protein
MTSSDYGTCGSCGHWEPGVNKLPKLGRVGECTAMKGLYCTSGAICLFNLWAPRPNLIELLGSLNIR